MEILIFALLAYTALIIVAMVGIGLKLDSFEARLDKLVDEYRKNKGNLL